ncbi:MAG: LegC family aminotransferase [Clostridiales bacterium]|nr:LegC family aminotransferase [Clostridiales bacterium]
MNDKENFIPLSVPNLKGNEAKYVLDAIEQEWVSTGGAYIDRFEKDFSAYAKTASAVACQSGTAALHLILLECGVKNGDLVIAPALTFIATINPVRYVSADPVFMDCDDSLCMDPEKLERYLSEECEPRDGVLYDISLNRPVKAVLVAHIFGNGADMERICEIASRYSLPVVEDAAESVGTFYSSGKYAGHMTGTIGDFGFFSFNGNKIITTGGGGMIVGQDEGRLEHIRFLSTQAKTDPLYYLHDEIGYNYRMTNLQAALGVAQLEQLESFIEIKERNYREYGEKGVPLLPFGSDVRPNYWFYNFLSRDRDALIRRLAESGIQSRPVWGLNHLQRPYAGCRSYRIEKAAGYREAIVSLPCSSGLGLADVDRVADAVLSIERESGR